MSFKNWWKKLKYWQKGGIIGIFIGFLPFLIIDLYTKIIGGGSLDRIALPLIIKSLCIIYLFPPTILISMFSMGEPTAMTNLSNTLLWYFFSIFSYFLIGITIGFIIDKTIRGRKNYNR